MLFNDWGEKMNLLKLSEKIAVSEPLAKGRPTPYQIRLNSGREFGLHTTQDIASGTEFMSCVAKDLTHISSKIPFSMAQSDILLSGREFSLVKQWMVVVQTPVHSLDELIAAIEKSVSLTQGHYSHCMYVRRGGQTRFKNEDGACGGAEKHVRVVDSAEIIIMLPHNLDQLSATLLSIRHHHVHEEPTISVTETWGWLTGDNIDTDNPNRYWNRPDANAIHGEVSK